MAYDTATRKKLRAKYVQGLALTSAAGVCQVPYNTARNWKRQAAEAGDDWDLERAALRLSKSGVEEMVNQVLHRLCQQFVTTLDALEKDPAIKPEVRSRILLELNDGYAKAMAATARGSPNHNRLSVALQVVKFLTDTLARRFPKIWPAFVDATQQLGPDIAREFGQGAR